MAYVLRLEAIGDHAAWRDSQARQFLAANGIAPAFVLGKNKPRRPWVARITEAHPKWGVEREFVNGKKDYSLANSVGSRGVYLYYTLRRGSVYEVFALTSWRGEDRYFCRVEGTEMVRMTLDEVCAWMEAHDE